MRVKLIHGSFLFTKTRNILLGDNKVNCPICHSYNIRPGIGDNVSEVSDQLNTCNTCDNVFIKKSGRLKAD